MPGGRPPTDPKKRFLKFVEVNENGCHEWTSTLHRDGYGKFYFDGRQMQAHRASYLLFSGSLPEKAFVLHKCDNRKCVNPKHLFIGDAKINMADMDAKGRRGTKSNLTYSQVEEIKKLFSDRKNSQQKIADLFGVDQTTISRIVLGKTTLFKP